MTGLAGIHRRSRMIPLRWMFPDAFFHFQDTGRLAFTLDEIQFPFNELNPQIKSVAMLLFTDKNVNPEAWQVRLAVPAHPATIVAAPNNKGEISLNSGHPWQPLATGPAIVDYLVEFELEENPGLVHEGKLKLDPIRNIVIILEYQYAPRE